MKFHIGDLVEVKPNDMRPDMAGRRGRIADAVPSIFCGALYFVDFSPRPVLCCECVLRLMPPDGEGRQVVAWDWKTLTRDRNRFSPAGPSSSRLTQPTPRLKVLGLAGVYRRKKA